MLKYTYLLSIPLLLIIDHCLGHECEEAADGLIALNKVKDKLAAVPVDGGGGSDRNTMYDAVLMDTNMPVQPPFLYMPPVLHMYPTYICTLTRRC